LQQKQNLLESIILVSHNNILKIASWSPGHYDVKDKIQNGRFMDISVVLFHEQISVILQLSILNRSIL